MFGDIGHGFILFMIGGGFVFFEEKFMRQKKKGQLGEVGNICAHSRCLTLIRTCFDAAHWNGVWWSLLVAVDGCFCIVQWNDLQ